MISKYNSRAVKFRVSKPTGRRMKCIPYCAARDAKIAASESLGSEECAHTLPDRYSKSNFVDVKSVLSNYYEVGENYLLTAVAVQRSSYRLTA